MRRAVKGVSDLAVVRGRGRRVMDTGWVPVSTARRLLGVSRQRVYQLVELGRLASMEMDGTVLIGAASIRTRLSEAEGRVSRERPSR
jgi:hypothetical protein